MLYCCGVWSTVPSDVMIDGWPFAWGGKTYIMAVVNVTPDSFSGDGLAGPPDAILGLVAELVAQGADLVDVGGESTRPGHQPVETREELARVLPALACLAAARPLVVSVDTRKAAVACRSLAAGATIVNDVSGLADPEMASTVADAGAGLIIVHHGSAAHGQDLLLTITRELDVKLRTAVRAGVKAESIAVDPGLGMGKDWRANLEIMRRLRELRSLECPIVVGPSRKGMIGRVLGADVGDRLEGTAALVTLAIHGGADVVRVHDVGAMSRVARMADALVRGRVDGPI